MIESGISKYHLSSTLWILKSPLRLTALSVMTLLNGFGPFLALPVSDFAAGAPVVAAGALSFFFLFLAVAPIATNAIKGRMSSFFIENNISLERVM
jgi:hypothetical protein